MARRMMKPHPVPPVGVSPSAEPTRSRLPYAHGWLAVTSWGEGKGPAVLLLHGWGGRGSNLAAFVDPLVEAGFRVVAYDAPAHGESDGENTSMIECSGAVLQVGRAFGPVRAAIAHSFGAPAAALAHEYGLEAERFVFIGPPISIMDLMIEIGETMGAPRHVCQLMVSDFEERFEFKREDLRTDNLVSQINVPVLVIHDSGDKVAPVDHGETIAAAAPQGTLFTTEGLGHRGVLSDPVVVAKAVEFVCERVPAGETPVRA